MVALAYDGAMREARLLASVLATCLLAACPAPRATAPIPLAGPSPVASPAPQDAATPAHSVAAVEAAACRAFAGAGSAIAPAVDPAAAPALGAGRRYDVALGAERTHLALAVPRAGEWSVFLGRDHFLLLLDPTEAVQFSVEDAAPPGCAGIARHLVFLLEAGVAYRLELAPAGTPGDPPLALFVGETHP